MAGARAVINFTSGVCGQTASGQSVRRRCVALGGRARRYLGFTSVSLTVSLSAGPSVAVQQVRSIRLDSRY